MFFKIISLCILLLFSTVAKAGANNLPIQKVKACPLESTCGKVNESSAICGWEEQGGCIRKYDSKCHLDIAACHAKKTPSFIGYRKLNGQNLFVPDFSDFNDVYCLMETYICAETPTYERWTIFFGHVKD